MDIKGTLWALAICLLLVIWLMAGCRSGLDRFRENREQRREDRQAWWYQWQQRREDRKDDRRGNRNDSDSDQDDEHHEPAPWWQYRRNKRDERRHDASEQSTNLGNHFPVNHTCSIDRLGGCAVNAL